LRYIIRTSFLELELVIFCILFNFFIFDIFLKKIFFFFLSCCCSTNCWKLDIYYIIIVRNSIFAIRQLLDIWFRISNCTWQIYLILIENNRRLTRILFAIYIFILLFFVYFVLKNFDYFFLFNKFIFLLNIYQKLQF